MNISAPSLSFLSLYAKSAPPAAVGRLPAPVSKEADSSKDCVAEHSSGRSNRLTQALSAALRDIGIGAAPAKTDAPATTDTVDSAAASTATPPAASDLNAVVEQFASALMDALAAGRGARGRGGEHRQDGEHGHHGHGGRHSGYGDLAQRLEGLSKTVVQALAPSTAAPVASAPVTSAPVTEAPISLPPTVESSFDATAPAVAAPAPAPKPAASSPLLDAFTKLFNALKPPATADAPATSMATRLQQFLHTMAQTLSRHGADSAAAPQSGAFIDVKA